MNNITGRLFTSNFLTGLFQYWFLCCPSFWSRKTT